MIFYTILMKTKIYYVLLLLLSLIFVLLKAQPAPFIGLNALPQMGDPICSEPVFTGSFFTSGYAVGATVSDFKLYKINGDSVTLSQVLGGGKPVLLVSGSLTCPVFRNKLADIQQVATAYAGLLEVFIVYTIEAHPTDTSVYYGYINTTSQNQTDGILFPSPLNYGQRVALADTLIQKYGVSVPVLIDGTCNEWWKHYGPAPNNAYVIRPNGTVAIHHGWFDRSPRNIFCELDTFLGVTSGLCNMGSTSGGFTLNILNQVSTGSPGSVLYNYIDIINNSTQDCEIDINKIQQMIPVGWKTAFCADICYSTQEDSIRILLLAGDTMHFSLDYFTGAIPDTGNIRLGFRNVNNPSNQFAFWTKGDTRTSTHAVDLAPTKDVVQVFPNPFNRCFSIPGKAFTPFSIWNSEGRQIQSGTTSEEGQICTEDITEGIYFLHIENIVKKVILNP